MDIDQSNLQWRFVIGLILWKFDNCKNCNPQQNAILCGQPFVVLLMFLIFLLKRGWSPIHGIQHAYSEFSNWGKDDTVSPRLFASILLPTVFVQLSSNLCEQFLTATKCLSGLGDQAFRRIPSGARITSVQQSAEWQLRFPPAPAADQLLAKHSFSTLKRESTEFLNFSGPGLYSEYLCIDISIKLFVVPEQNHHSEFIYVDHRMQLLFCRAFGWAGKEPLENGLITITTEWK